MSLQFRIKVKNWDKASSVLKGSQDEFDKGIKKALDWSTNLVQKEASKMAPVDTGRLRGSLNSRITSFGKAGAIGTNVEYAEYVHGDGKAKRSKPHFPPISAVEGWARRHKISPFLVAKAIAEKGTKLVPFLSDPLYNNKRKIKARFGRELENALSDLASQIK